MAKAGPNPDSDAPLMTWGALGTSGWAAQPLGHQRSNPMSKTGERGRDAGNGQFIPVEEAERRKKNAIVERFKKDKNGRPLN
jgi:hypothetical protein